VLYPNDVPLVQFVSERRFVCICGGAFTLARMCLVLLVTSGYSALSVCTHFSVCDQDGETALMKVSEAGHTATVHALVGAGADPNLQDTVSNAHLTQLGVYVLCCPASEFATILPKQICSVL
jgi:competence protein ComGC